MARVLPALIATLLLAASLGCEKTPQENLAGHLDAMVTLLEENRDNPDAAADALQDYVTAHREELVALRSAVDARREGMSKEELADLASDLLQELGPVMQRAEALMREKPGLAENARIRKALEAIDQ